MTESCVQALNGFLSFCVKRRKKVLTEVVRSCKFVEYGLNSRAPIAT
jgi:hypothetical protein